MSVLQVANLHFNSTGSERIDQVSGNISITTAGRLLLRSNNFVVTANGDVGIGTDDPAAYGANYATLTIGGRSFGGKDGDLVLYYSNNKSGVDFYVSKGGTPASDSQNIFFYDSNLSQVWSISFNGTADSSGLKLETRNTNSPITFRPNNVTRVTFDTAGNVLIGRTTSTVGLGVKLDVNGAINTSALYVNGSPISGGATINDQISTNFLQYPLFTTTTSGTASSLNVATTKITFNVTTGTLSSTVFNSTSDENKKENITTILDSLNTISNLRGVKFDWKDNGKTSYGLIAQEVEHVIPEIVATENETKTLNYDSIIGFLVEAIKELKAEIDILKAKS